MHIPDGYLSPATCATLYAVSAPFWYVAGQKLKGLLSARTVPLLSLFSAFSFVVMMFNIPLPGGTTGHAVGAALMAIVLGPWAAVVGVSVALAIQALLFGDGGILALGANSFNMAIAMPFVAYGVYSALAGSSALESPRRPVAAAIAGYLAINVAGLLTAVELGLQPLLFQANGAPLYFPYGLSVALPAMVIPHLLVAGFAEALVAGLVVAYLQRAHRPLLELRQPANALHGGGRERGVRATDRRRLGVLWIGLAVIVLITPLGLLAPGGAWAEWSADEVEQLVGAVPAGMQSLMSFWSAPIPDYAIPGLEGSFGSQSLGYVLSGLIGVGLVVLASWLFGKLSRGKNVGRTP